MARITNPDDFLIHYGIVGMKWGKRKTTNNASPSALKTHTPFEKDPNRNPPPAKGVTDLSPKHIKRISDVELRNRINRLQMETQYKQLTEGKTAPDKSKAREAYEKFEKGHDVVKKVLAVTKTLQTIYKLYDSNEVRMLRGLEPKDNKKK